MPARTPPGLVAEIRRLHDAGLSYAEIHRQTRVARSTIGAHCRRSTTKKPPKGQPKAPRVVPPDVSRKAEYCTGCKAKVYLPCVACQVRRIMKHQRMGGV